MKKYILLILVLPILFTSNLLAKSIFVKEFGIGDFTGKNWDNAINGTDLVTTLENAIQGDTIYVSEGVYNPFFSSVKWDGTTLRYNKDCSFLISKGVTLYGGFSKLSTGLNLDIHDINQYITTFSGNMGCSPNSNHVVVFNGVLGGTLDGVVVREGFASGTSEDGKGAGVYIADSTFNVNISNCQIIANTAAIGGAGIFVSPSAIVNINKTTICNNTCTSTSYAFGGGGISICGSSKTSLATQVELINSTVAFNKAATSYGGGICVYKPTSTNLQFSSYFCTINSNSAIKGGGVYADTTILLDNVLLSGNSNGYDLVYKSSSNPNAMPYIKCNNSIIYNKKYLNNTTIDASTSFPATLLEYLNYSTWKYLSNATPTLELVNTLTNPAINAGDIIHLNTNESQSIYIKCRISQNNINRILQPAIGAYQPIPLTNVDNNYDSLIKCYMHNNNIRIDSPDTISTVEIFSILGVSLGKYIINQSLTDLQITTNDYFIILKIGTKSHNIIRTLLNYK
jgi:hypothetical protein